MRGREVIDLRTSLAYAHTFLSCQVFDPREKKLVAAMEIHVNEKGRGATSDILPGRPASCCVLCATCLQSDVCWRTCCSCTETSIHFQLTFSFIHPCRWAQRQQHAGDRRCRRHAGHHRPTCVLESGDAGALAKKGIEEKRDGTVHRQSGRSCYHKDPTCPPHVCIFTPVCSYVCLCVLINTRRSSCPTSLTAWLLLEASPLWVWGMAACGWCGAQRARCVCCVCVCV